MSTTPSTGDTPFGDGPSLDEVRQRIAAAWDVVGREVRPGKAVDVEEIERKSFARRHPVLLATTGLLLAAGTAAAAVPLTGNSEEAIAMVGERFFDVAPLPADLSVPNERSRVYDASGNLLTILSGPENRRIVPLENIPEVFRNAVIATEDARFWTHDGLDAQGIVRAGVANYRAGEVKQGASTITQQYVKNVLLTSERSFERKITEAVWAVRLEEELSKEDILEGYFNIVYFGGGTYGVAAAAEYWFGLPVEELDLSRSAVLASMISAPAAVDLANDPEASAAGRATVLREMVSQGMVTQAEADDANAIPVADLVDITPLPEPEQPMFVRHIVDVLLDSPALGDTREERANKIFGGGLEISTTLDPRLQADAVTTLSEFVSDPTADPMAGIVSVVPGDGAIRAMALGPQAWGHCDGIAEDVVCTTTTVNPLVAGAGSPGRQVGSSFKPILLAAALEQGISTDWHTDTDGGEAIAGCPEDWEPENYSERSGGIIDMPKALTTSNNIYHVKLGAAVGMEHVTDLAARLGIPDLPPYCSLPLGSVESHPVTMAAAYATFANDGAWCEPYAVADVRDRTGELVFTHQPRCEQVLDPEIARTVTAMLEDNVEAGTATRGQIGRPAAAKTGTTNDFRDAWLVGFTPQLATAVWVGFEQPREMRGILGFRVVAGGTVPAQIWGTYMARAMESIDVVEFADVDLDRWSGGCSGDRDDFEEGRQRCAPKPVPTPDPATPDPAAPPPAPAPQPEPKPKDDGPKKNDKPAEPTPAPEPTPTSSPQPAPAPAPERAQTPAPANTDAAEA